MGSVFCLGWKNAVKGALPLFHKQEHTHTHVCTRVLWQCLGGRDLSPMPPILAPSPWVKAEKGQRWFFGGLKIKFHMTEHLCCGGPLERKCLACLNPRGGLCNSSLWELCWDWPPVQHAYHTAPPPHTHTAPPASLCLLVRGGCFELCMLHNLVDLQCLRPFHELQYVWPDTCCWMEGESQQSLHLRLKSCSANQFWTMFRCFYKRFLQM